MLGSFTLFRCFLQPRFLSNQRLHAEVVAERRPGEGVDRGDCRGGSRGGGGGMSGERLARGRPAVVFRHRFLEEGEYVRRLLLTEQKVTWHLVRSFQISSLICRTA